MATTLQTFIDELIPVIRAVSDINFVPDDAPDTIATFPAGVVYPDSGRMALGPPEVTTYHHNIVVAIMTPLVDLAHASRILTPKLEPVVEAIYTAFTNNTFTTLENIASMSYTFQPVEWGGISLVGFFITLEEVKVQRNL